MKCMSFFYFNLRLKLITLSYKEFTKPYKNVQVLYIDCQQFMSEPEWFITSQQPGQTGPRVLEWLSDHILL